ncbi:TPA: hypothetical protein GRI37_22920 [Vibrio parahaemolyticus]|nr:hypothetical protein [Vibrio parahaemolyticus]HAS6755923.1 hypothetical protein [Vibrio parahaemolyticus]HAS6775469.1 hypothetical protein [Vibrio parahaemolyticus]HAS6863441.1 hypothetical protein [Vibrio parahaemolyticus]HAS6877883.1 hypothetical protein [Vibrio parahaemolyticus]
MNPTSFICERSAEYALIPELMKELKKKFEYVTPIYPWISREGSNISKELHGMSSFKVIGLYARRPKLSSLDDPTIKVKFSEQIIYGSRTAWKLGIPIIAGCPLARDFMELGDCKKFLWANLSKFSSHDIDFIAEVNADGVVSNQPKGYFFNDLSEVSALVDSASKDFDIRKFIEVIKDIKMNSKGYNQYVPMAFMGGYKPVYFLLANP